MKESITYLSIKVLRSHPRNLVRNGFDIIKVDDNENNTKFKVFLFYDSLELRNQMKNFNRQAV